MKAKSPMCLFNALLLGASVSVFSSGVANAESPEGGPYQREQSRARMERPDAEDRADAATILRQSTDVYRSISSGTENQVPQNVLSKAKCVVVVPSLTTGAIVIGGSHGTGVASCKENNNWTPPAFVSMNAVSLGAQIGAKSTDLVMYITNDDAKNALRRGKIEFGADASAVAGSFDKSFDTSNAGAVVYSRTGGAFVGVSIAGGNISGADTETIAFYGPQSNANFDSLLSGRTSIQNAEAKKFTDMLPR